MIIPCISLWQPWASLVVSGVKLHETRSWWAPKKFIGKRIGIHASKTKLGYKAMSNDLSAICIKRWGVDYKSKLPLGAMLGIATLRYCQPISMVTPADEADIIAGNWSQGRFAWRLWNILEFGEPVPARGRQGFFNWGAPSKYHAYELQPMYQV